MRGPSEAVPRHVMVGTAGHIDHGKSALVTALTGIDPDRLKEEKERGITIDLGFANLKLGETQFGFVDVPGHERFVKTMLAGVHGIDLVMLVVSADESVMPQTREHFDICRLLKIPRGLIVLTKIDLVEEELLQLVEAEVRELVAGSFLAGAPVIPVSARTGAGLERLKTGLAAAAEGLPERDSGTLVRMPIDRVFTIRGFGTVVTGTLISGMLEAGDPVEILPAGLRTSVRGIQVHGRTVPRAFAGERTAINVQNLGVSQLTRGDLITGPGLLRVTSLVDVRIELLAEAPQPLGMRARVRLHHGSAELLARAVPLDSPELRPGETGIVQFRLERPAAFLAGDRFIVRRYSPPITIGGGAVIDPLPAKHRPYSERRKESMELAAELRRISIAPLTEQLEWWVASAGAHGLGANDLSARTGFGSERLKGVLEGLSRTGSILEIPEGSSVYFSKQGLAELERQMFEALRSHHAALPLSPGMSREEVRRRLLPWASQDRAQAVVDHLCAHPEIDSARDVVRLASHAVRLGAEENSIEARFLSSLREEGLQPALPAEIFSRLGIEAGVGTRLLTRLSKSGRIVRAGEHYYCRETIDSLAERLRSIKPVEPTIDINRFKTLTGLSRKYAIPLLEHLDRLNVTRREGDGRRIL